MVAAVGKVKPTVGQLPERSDGIGRHGQPLPHVGAERADVDRVALTPWPHASRRASAGLIVSARVAGAMQASRHAAHMTAEVMAK